MPAQHNIAVYANGLFLDTTLPCDEQLRQMRGSAFNTIVLWALHVRDGGDFYYNDNLAVRDGQMMWRRRRCSTPSYPSALPAFARPG